MTLHEAIRHALEEARTSDGDLTPIAERLIEQTRNFMPDMDVGRTCEVQVSGEWEVRPFYALEKGQVFQVREPEGDLEGPPHTVTGYPCIIPTPKEGTYTWSVECEPTQIVAYA